jgi:hypothetical protein
LNLAHMGFFRYVAKSTKKNQEKIFFELDCHKKKLGKKLFLSLTKKCMGVLVH